MKLLPFDEAVDRVLELVVPTEVDVVTLDAAIGRSLIERAVAARDLPATDVAAMDGYAVRTADLGAVPVELEVVATVYAGQTPGPLHLRPGQAVKVATGATVLEGADAVVPVEKSALLAEGLVEIEERVEPGANVRRRGEEIQAGTLLLMPGVPIGLAEAAALWAQGIVRVSVHGRPSVAIAACGDELCGPWEEPRGRIVDTNSPMLSEAVRLAGGVATPLGILPDRVEALTAGLAKGFKHQVLVIAGGSSVGDRDHTRTALERLGVTLDFFGVAMKPGRPVGFGRRDSTVVFALPGNPVSALVTFELLVRPALLVMQGLPPGTPPVPVRLAAPLRPAPAVTSFVRATTEYREGELWASPLRSQSSAAITAAIGATHLLQLPPGEAELPRGAAVQARLLSWACR